MHTGMQRPWSLSFHLRQGPIYKERERFALQGKSLTGGCKALKRIDLERLLAEDHTRGARPIAGLPAKRGIERAWMDHSDGARYTNLSRWSRIAHNGLLNPSRSATRVGGMEDWL